MIAGVFGLLLANVTVALGAGEITGHLKTGEAPLDGLLFLLVRLALLSAAVLVAGLCHLLSPLGLGALSTAALVGLLALGAHRRVRRPSLPEAGTVLWVLAGVVVVRLLLQVWFFSPHLGDALAYHLPKIAEWIRAGEFTREMGLHPHAPFPAGFELVETWWVVFLRHDVLIEMAGVEFLLLAFAATYALAKGLNLGDRGAFFAGFLFVLTPGLHLSATSCLNDAPVAALVVATFALVAGRVRAPLVLLAVGLGIGVKATYAYTLPGVLLLGFLSRKDAPRPLASPRGAIAIALVGAILGGFWYGRNLLWFGNPVYPVGSPGYAELPVAVQAGPSVAGFLSNASDLLNSRIYDNQGPYGANVDNIAGWGPVAFACGLVALVLGWREDPRLRRVAVSFGVSLAGAFLLMIHDPWSLKYVFFFPALLSIAAARLALQSRPALGITAAAGAVAFLGTLLPYDLQFKHLRVLASQSWRTRTALPFAEPDLPESRIGCFGGFLANAYLLYGPDFSRDVVYLRPDSAAELVEGMTRAGLTLLYAAPVTSRESSILAESVRGGHLVRLGGSVYRLK